MNINDLKSAIEAAVAAKNGALNSDSLLYWLKEFVDTQDIQLYEDDRDIVDMFAEYLESHSLKEYKKIFGKANSPIECWQLICWSDEPEALAYLVKNKIIDKDIKNESGKTVLHFAARAGSVAMMHAAVQLGISPNALDNIGNSILYFATLSGNIHAVDKAIALGVSENVVGRTGRTLLHHAALSGSVPVMYRAIELGNLPHVKTVLNEDILHFAAVSGSVSAMELAVMLGANPAAIDTEGRGVLYHAAASGSMPAIKKALELGADPKTCDPDGGTLLHLAALSGNVEAMDLALKLGLDPKALNNEGLNILHLASSSGSEAAIAKAIELGLEHGDKITNDQYWYIDLLQKLNIKSDKEGMCQGLTGMAMHAAFLGEMDEFDERLKLLATYIGKSDLLKHDIDEVKECVKRNEELTIEQEKLLDCQIFFEGIALYQAPKYFAHQFFSHTGQSYEATNLLRPMIMPDRLKENGGIIDELGMFEVDYRKDELEKWIERFQKLCENKHFPVVMTLARDDDDSGHIILLSYDPKKNNWILVDPNNLPSKRFAFSDLAGLNKQIIEYLKVVPNGSSLEGVILAHSNHSKQAEMSKFMREVLDCMMRDSKGGPAQKR